MKKWLRKLLGLNDHEKLDMAKESLFIEKKKALDDLKRINKRFKLIIDAQNIELVVKDIDQIRNGK